MFDLVLRSSQQLGSCRIMSGRSDNLLIIPYKHTKFEGPTVGQIVFDISCRRGVIAIILQEKSDCFQKLIGLSTHHSQSAYQVAIDCVGV